MKKLLFVITAAFGCYTAQAQTSGWEVGWTASGGASFGLNTRLSLECPVGVPIDKVGLEPSGSYSAGVMGRKFFKNMFGIEIGVQYTSVSLRTYQFGGGYLWTVDKSDPSRYTINYVETPLRFVFKKDIKKFSIGFFTGMSAAMRTRSRVYNKNLPENGRQDFTEQTLNINLIADAGLLLRANLCEHFSLEARPYFRASLRPTYYARQNYFNTQFMTTGISLAGVWQF